MGFYYQFTNNYNDLYIELNIWYNSLRLIAGLLMILSNVFYTLIILYFKLTKNSILYVLSIYLAGESVLLGSHHMFVSILNFIVSDPNKTSYNSSVCRIRSITEIFLLYLFETTFAIRVIIFIIMLNYPLTYRNLIDRNRKGKLIIFPIIVLAFLATIFFTIDSFSITRYKFCNLYASFGKIYEIFFVGLIGFVVLATIPVMYLGGVAITKMKVEGNYKNSVIQLLNYEITVFTGCWFVPNMCIFICYFIHIKNDQMGMIYDISSLMLTISGIVEFPFTLWKNRDVKNCLYKVLGIKVKKTVNNRAAIKRTNMVSNVPSKFYSGKKILNELRN